MAEMMLMIAGVSPSSGAVDLPLPDGCSGSVTVARYGQDVTLTISGLILPAGSGVFDLVTIPAGFRTPRAFQMFGKVYSGAITAPTALYDIVTDGRTVRWVGHSWTGDRTHPTSAAQGMLLWSTNNAWPN